jgi:hypothetical protein
VLRTSRRLLPVVFLLAVVGSTLTGPTAAAQDHTVAVFGDNYTDDYLNSAGFTATVVSNADLETPGFLNGFDAFFYTRDNADTPGPSLSSAAAANVQAYVAAAGRGVLLNGDFADTINPDLVTPDPDVQQLFTNAVDWAASTGHGYIGEYTGAAAGLSSNSDGLTPLGFVDGSAGVLQDGPALGPIDETTAGANSAVLEGISFPMTDETGERSFGSLFTGLTTGHVLATYENNGNPAIIDFSTPDPPTLNEATPGNHKVGFNWSPPVHDGGAPITSYTIYADPCPTAGPSPCAVASVSPTLNGPPIVSGDFTTITYLLSPIANGTYTFTVTASNRVGESGPSNGLVASPNVSADVGEVTNGTGSLNTGFGTPLDNADTQCDSASDASCHDVAGKYTKSGTDGTLIGLGAVPNDNNSQYGTIPCLEIELNPSSPEYHHVVTDGECVADKQTQSLYPTESGSVPPHLEYQQYDSSVTTFDLGAPCQALKYTTSKPSQPRWPLQCTNPSFPLFNDPNVGGMTNICPEGTGWTPTKQCAYIYYDVLVMPGFDLSQLGQTVNGTLVGRPVACAQTNPQCGAPKIIGSSLAAGIHFGTTQAVNPWCNSALTIVPCDQKWIWMSSKNSPAGQRYDVQILEQLLGDPGTLKTG